jgi:folate-binding protein YgfZ
VSDTGPGASLAEDYAALRHGCGARRLERDAVVLFGPGATDYLQGQCSQDVAAMAVGSAADALLLEPDGKLSALVRVVRTDEDRYLLDTDRGVGPAVVARLARFRLRSKVEIEPLAEDEWVCVGLRGPTSPPPLAAAEGVRALRYDWNGVAGVDLVGPAAAGAAPEGARWCDAPAWEALRVEAGIPVMGRELDGRTIAPEAHLVGRTVSLTKGCYTGQELIARLDARGNRVARRLCGVVPAGPADDDLAGRLVGAALVSVEGKHAGEVTSAAWCPGLAGPAALAYLHRSVEVPGPVRIVLDRTDGGEPVALEAEARPLPLIG